MPVRTLLLVLFFGMSNLLFAETLPPVPSIQQNIDKFNQQYEEAGKKDKNKEPKISAVDMEVMKRSSAELARAMPAPGLKVGEKAPGFTLNNAFGKSVSLAKHLKKGPVVITFYRGAWCPYCNLELHALKQSMPHFKKYGASVIAITPQQPDKSLAQVKKDKYPFEILSDLDSSVMKNYRLYFEVPPELSDVYQRNFKLDISAYNGKGRNVLPVPGTFVVDRKGIVRAAFADTDYKKRMEPADIIAALKKL